MRCSLERMKEYTTIITSQRVAPLVVVAVLATGLAVAAHMVAVAVNSNSYHISILNMAK